MAEIHPVQRKINLGQDYLSFDIFLKKTKNVTGFDLLRGFVRSFGVAIYLERIKDLLILINCMRSGVTLKHHCRVFSDIFHSVK